MVGVRRIDEIFNLLGRQLETTQLKQILQLIWFEHSIAIFVRNAEQLLGVGIQMLWSVAGGVSKFALHMLCSVLVLK